MSWTDDRVARLKKLWADGLSASQVAADLGGVTRNAVIGKIHRLGLSGRAKPVMRSGAKSKAKIQHNVKRSDMKVVRKNNSKSLIKAISTPMGQTEDLIAPKPKRMQLVELSEKTCKWPIGDPQDADFCFCGHTVKEDTPYCEYHCKLAYQPIATRRRIQKTNV